MEVIPQKVTPVQQQVIKEVINTAQVNEGNHHHDDEKLKAILDNIEKLNEVVLEQKDRLNELLDVINSPSEEKPAAHPSE